MTQLVAVALAPVLICAFYIYFRDKYEKEPVRLLITGVLYGVLITVPIVHTENFVTLFVPNQGWMMESFWMSFMVASLVEEGYKFAILFFLVWQNHNFNERFDGIVYGVFISLGFAGLENLLYVLNPMLGGLETGIARAIVSVPGHAIFGITMGYHFAMAKFENKGMFRRAVMAFVVPFLLHGVYDFILMTNTMITMPLFVAFVVYLWILGSRNIRKHIEKSPFKPVT